MPLIKAKVGANSNFEIPTLIKTVAANSDYFIGVDAEGLLYKILKSDLLAGLTSGTGGTGTGGSGSGTGGTDTGGSGSGTGGTGTASSGSGTGGTSSASNIVLLMHFDGSDNSNVFTDIKGHTIIPSGSPYLSTIRSKFSDASLHLNGSSFLSITKDSFLTFGTSDLTFEAWIYLTNNISGANNMSIMGNAQGGAGGNAGLFLCINAGKLLLRHWVNGNTSATSLADVSPNVWHHVAGCKSGTILNVFLDGIKGIPGATDLSNSDYDFTIGTVPNNSGYATNFDGDIDELRVCSKAIYTSNFTPPIAAFANT